MPDQHIFEPEINPTVHELIGKLIEQNPKIQQEVLFLKQVIQETTYLHNQDPLRQSYKEEFFKLTAQIGELIRQVVQNQSQLSENRLKSMYVQYNTICQTLYYNFFHLFHSYQSQLHVQCLNMKRTLLEQIRIETEKRQNAEKRLADMYNSIKEIIARKEDKIRELQTYIETHESNWMKDHNHINPNLNASNDVFLPMETDLKKNLVNNQDKKIQLIDAYTNNEYDLEKQAQLMNKEIVLKDQEIQDLLSKLQQLEKIHEERNNEFQAEISQLQKKIIDEKNIPHQQIGIQTKNQSIVDLKKQNENSDLIDDSKFNLADVKLVNKSLRDQKIPKYHSLNKSNISSLKRSRVQNNDQGLVEEQFWRFLYIQASTIQSFLQDDEYES